MAKKNDNGMEELLGLLRKRPELIKELVFDSESVKRFLRSKAARELISDPCTETFLDYIAGPQDGYPVVWCLGGTRSLCAKGTGQCLGGTRAACLGGTSGNKKL
jgi:hypothetical protein